MKSTTWWCVTVVLSVAAISAEEQLPWWRTAVFYQVYPRSFKDSDGDGVGDIKGIIQKANYFKEIGVDAIWMNPINPSPMVDFGYDIVDFKSIDPLFGTMEDFETLVRKLREIDVKLVLDFVPNHTSDKHPWFLKSLENDPEYSDFYVWEDPKWDSNGIRKEPNNWITELGESAWEWSEKRHKYFLHQFTRSQPDLNFRNPKVLEKMTEVLEFWLDKGVDGFRVDAVKYIVEDHPFLDDPALPGTTGDSFRTQQHLYEHNQPENYDVVRRWSEVVYKYIQKDNRPRAMFLEVYDPIPIAVTFYGTDHLSFQIPFNFNLVDHGDLASRPEDLRKLIGEWMKAMPPGGVPNWVVSNHDVRRVSNRYGSDMVDAIQLLTGVLPGVKGVYYGEEIGMEDTFIRWEQAVDPVGTIVGPSGYRDKTRDPFRTPMQWNSSPSAGFSSKSKTWLPVNPNYWWLNVEAQRKAETSHLKVFQALTRARRDDVLQRGDLNVIVHEQDSLIIVRSYAGSYFVLIINMGSEMLTYDNKFFTQHNLNMDMTVVVVSTNNSDYKPGFKVKKHTQKIILRPKAAILLRSGNISSSSLRSNLRRLIIGSSIALSSLLLFSIAALLFL